MLNQEETANVVTLLEDLQTDLRNGNIPASKLLIISIVNCLALKQPLEWKSLGDFISDNLEEAQIRTSLLHFLPKVKLLVGSSQSVQEADKE